MPKPSVLKALRNFQRAPLYEGAMRLLNALGIEGTGILDANFRGRTLAEFFEIYPAVDKKLTDRERKIFNKLIRQISFVCQVSERDTHLQISDGIKGGIVAHTLIFVAIDIRNDTFLFQDDLQSITWGLNKAFPQPVIGLFRHRNRMAFAATAQRLHKRYPEKDAQLISGVTMNIRLKNPHWKHRDFLDKLSRIVKSESGFYFGDVVNHLAYVLNEHRAYYMGEITDAPEMLRLYLSEVVKWPVLSKMEEQKLARSTSPDAREYFICSNLKLVIGIARKYAWATGIDLLDLIQEGNKGVMKAVKRFDPDRGTKFSTYAVQWIHQKISRAIANQARLIRVPVHAMTIVNKIRRKSHHIQNKTNRDATLEEIVEETELPDDKASKLMEIIDDPVSLVGFVDDKIYESAVGESMGSDINSSSDIALNRYYLRMLLDKVLSNLTPKEITVIRMRYGIDMDSDHTLQEVGSKLGVTRERIRQIQAKALRKLRHPSRSGHLRDFWV